MLGKAIVLFPQSLFSFFFNCLECSMYHIFSVFFKDKFSQDSACSCLLGLSHV